MQSDCLGGPKPSQAPIKLPVVVTVKWDNGDKWAPIQVPPAIHPCHGIPNRDDGLFQHQTIHALFCILHCCCGEKRGKKKQYDPTAVQTHRKRNFPLQAFFFFFFFFLGRVPRAPSPQSGRPLLSVASRIIERWWATPESRRSFPGKCVD